MGMRSNMSSFSLKIPFAQANTAVVTFVTDKPFSNYNPAVALGDLKKNVSLSSPPASDLQSASLYFFIFHSLSFSIIFTRIDILAPLRKR